MFLGALSAGLNLLTWTQDSFGLADSYDEAAGRYRGLRGGTLLNLTNPQGAELVVRPEVASRQLAAERAAAVAQLPGDVKVNTVGDGRGGGGTDPAPPSVLPPTLVKPPVATQPKRFHGTVNLDEARVGRDASKIAEEVIAHLVALVGARVTVTLEIEADVPVGAPDKVVRTLTENCRTLKFTSHGFERD